MRQLSNFIAAASSCKFLRLSNFSRSWKVINYNRYAIRGRSKFEKIIKTYYNIYRKLREIYINYSGAAELSGEFFVRKRE